MIEIYNLPEFSTMLLLNPNNTFILQTENITVIKDGEIIEVPVHESYLKMAFILIKVVYLCTMFSMAIYSYYQKKNGFTKETLVFVFFIIEMVALVIYDLV